MTYTGSYRYVQAVLGLATGACLGFCSTIGIQRIADYVGPADTQEVRAGALQTLDSMPPGPIEITLSRSNYGARYGISEYTATVDAYGRVQLTCVDGKVVWQPRQYDIGAERAYHLAVLLFRSGYFSLSDRDDTNPTARASWNGQISPLITVTRVRIGDHTKEVRHRGVGGSDLDILENLIDTYLETTVHFPTPQSGEAQFGSY
jgi:hypothetical protein